MSIYVHKNNQSNGPFDECEVLTRLRNGQLSGEDFGWRAGMDTWQPLNKLFSNPNEDSATELFSVKNKAKEPTPALGTEILGLGKVIKEYPKSGWAVVKIVFITAIFGLLALAFLTATVVQVMMYGFSQDTAGVIVGAVVGILLALPAVFGGAALWKTRRDAVSLSENGFFFRHRGKEFTARWEEVASLTVYRACFLEKKNGENIFIGRLFKDFEEITGLLREKILDQTLRPATAALLRGSTVEFKSNSQIPWVLRSEAKLGFVLDAQGITSLAEGQRIAWSEIREAGFYEGSYAQAPEPFWAVNGSQTGFEIRTALLPNIFLLDALCNEMILLHRNHQSFTGNQD